mgnify:FL=1
MAIKHLMDLDKTPISISMMSDLAKCQMRLGLHCLECDRWSEIIPQEWLDAGKPDVNYIEQKFKCSGCGGRASKQVQPPSGGLSNANAYQGL